MNGRGDRSRDTLKILWGYCPTEVRAALRPILVDYLWLVPPWCQSLYVRWEGKPEDPDSNASSSAQPEYRQAQLSVHPGWLAEIHATRVHNVIHELVHVPVAPMVVEHEDLAERLLDDAPRFRGYAQEQWRRSFECAVQDIATAIGQLPGPFPVVSFVEVDDDDQGKRDVPAVAHA
ncbi:MAG: hypothetical protein K0A98_16175 [Trueperaceae bacterium]|nr:hypothetical protein [Trueperaceae bacterium]